MRKWVLIFLAFLWGASLSAQELSQYESRKAYLTDIGQKQKMWNLMRVASDSTFKTVSELQKWYLLQEMNLGQRYREKSLKLRGIYSYFDYGKTLYSGHWYAAIEYQFPTLTNNAVFSIYSNRFTDRFTGSIKGILGRGASKVKKIDDKIASNLGIALELDMSTHSKLFNPFLGISQMWIDPEIAASGGSMNMYIGNRFFIFDRLVSLDVKGGLAYWRGFNEKGLGDYFLSAGLGFHKDVAFTWAGPPLLSTLESSLMYSPIFSTIMGKFTLPIRLFNELSFGLSASLASDTRTMKNKPLVKGSPLFKDEFSSFYGLGIDIRLFGDRLNEFPMINPYISIMKNFIEYERGTNDGVGYMVYFGGRFKLKGPLSLDIFTGPAFWKSPWVTNKTEPEKWNLGMGVTYQIGKMKPKITKLKGQILIYNDKDMYDGTSYPKEKEIFPLNSDIAAREMYETRIYSLEEKPTPPPPKPDPVYGDVTDIKFFMIDLEIKIGPQLTTKSVPINLLPESAGDVLLVALFDKEKARTDRIKPENMLLHFVDVENSRYFGYRWDRNRRSQPEIRDFSQLNLYDRSKPIFYGNYHEYVDTLQWLDNSTLFGGWDGSYLEKRILEIIDSSNAGLDTTNLTSDPTIGPTKPFSQSNYRLAFISMKKEVIEKIKSVCPNFGVSIQFNKDLNENGKVVFRKSDVADQILTNKEGADYPEQMIFSYDPGDAIFFSNTVQVKQLSLEKGILEPEQGKTISKSIVSSFEINNFNLGKATLTEELMKTLKEKLSELKESGNSFNEINIFGYTDATPFVEKSIYKTNYQLSLARAQRVKDALHQLGISPQIITTCQGLGIKNKGKVKAPEDRSVMINFIR